MTLIKWNIINKAAEYINFLPTLLHIEIYARQK